MSQYKDFIIDMETLGSKPDSIVIDISVLVFDPDFSKPVETIEELIKRGKRWKLDLPSQRGVRSVNPETIKWWREQSAEAQLNLKPAPGDLTVEQAIPEVIEFLKSNGVNAFKSQGWCRGMSFDFPIFVDMIRQTYNVIDTDKLEPVKFWAQRDVRTAIEAYLTTRNLAMTPLRKGTLDGFVAHDSIHDCAKDVIMLKTAQRYATGLEDIPAEDDIDPDTIKKQK
jgi:hypothetical protein